MMMAVLALAGCGEGKYAEVDKKVAPVVQAQPPQAATTPQWDVLVAGTLPQATSDLAGWLIEHGIISYVVVEDGKDRVLIGPFDSQAEAEAKKAELVEKLTKAKKRNIEPQVIEHRVAQ
ncbi:penicillin-binding protein activator LpoB [Pseudomonas sp. GW456-L14]|uniref:penicillin-binding protein activator LpoB n=1 Tax=unclassified Pseudomonas TaxID=196821 RepID=UPI000C884957|nr:MULTISPECIES: penicillin-binding protein activator LpoB [unclassified Pseudomonas]PMY37387.1 penicillin-binding protein activator LpoB [Pseudomonas sp. GW456-L14]PMY59296.1 penicillin-binding protein activator LpoB [Pseudomonas sp. GW456-L12]